MGTDRQPNFMPMPSPAILRWAVLGVFFLSAVMGWFVLFGNDAPSRQTASIGTAAQEYPHASTSPVGNSVPRALGTTAVNSIASGIQKGTIRYYEERTGRAFAADLRSGKMSILSDARLDGFVRSWWLTGQERVISLFTDGTGDQYRFFEYGTQRVASLGAGIVALAVAPDGEHVAYLAVDGDAFALYVSDPDGERARKLLSSRAESPHLAWPQDDLLALESRRPGRSGTDLTLITTDGTLVPLLVDQEGLETAWSADGRSLLYSSFLPGEGLSLRYRTLAARADVPLMIRTSAHKCAWYSSDTGIVCGVPQKDALVRDVPSDLTATVDDIVTLDLATGEQRTVYGARQGTLIGVIDPFVEQTGFLVFRNLFDRRAYTLPLETR